MLKGFIELEGFLTITTICISDGLVVYGMVWQLRFTYILRNYKITNLHLSDFKNIYKNFKLKSQLISVRVKTDRWEA